MTLLLDGISEYFAHAKRKLGIFEEKYPISDCSQPNRMPYTDQITAIALSMRTYFRITI